MPHASFLQGFICQQDLGVVFSEVSTLPLLTCLLVKSKRETLRNHLIRKCLVFLMDAEALRRRITPDRVLCPGDAKMRQLGNTRFSN